MTTSMACGYPLKNGTACNNPKKENAIACWRHQNIAIRDARNASNNSIRTSDSLIFRGSNLVIPPQSWASSSELAIEIVSSDTGIDPQIVRAAIQVQSSLSEKYGNMTIPDNATRALIETGVPEYCQLLSHSGIGPERISLIEVTGLKRQIMGSEPLFDYDFMHKICVFDRNETHDGFAVEPFMAAFSPSNSRSEEVDSVVSTYDSPFTDSPWIGTVSEYLNGNQMAWNKANFTV